MARRSVESIEERLKAEIEAQGETLARLRVEFERETARLKVGVDHEAAKQAGLLRALAVIQQREADDNGGADAEND